MYLEGFYLTDKVMIISILSYIMNNLRKVEYVKGEKNGKMDKRIGSRVQHKSCTLVLLVNTEEIY